MVPRAGDSDVPTAVARALRALRAVADADRRDGMRSFFKRDDRVSFFGVKVPEVRRIGRELYREGRGAWGYRDALAFCGALVERAELEAKLLGVFVLARYESAFPRGLLRTVKHWLARDRLASWAAVDAAVPSLITPLVVRYPDLAGRVAGWTRAESLWVRRAAAVTFVPLARRGERLDDAYAVAEALLDDEEDLIHKATGWMLREAGKTDMARLETFLRTWGLRVPRTTVRYAIERFPPTRRRRLLQATK